MLSDLQSPDDLTWGSPRQKYRVAIIHDWLATFTGAERVLEQILKLYPGADVFCLVNHLPQADRSFLEGHEVMTSWLQKAPLSRKHFRKYLPLMPNLIEEFDLSAYDVVISSSWAFAKGVLVGAAQPHISYIHTPIRYASQLKFQYLEQSNLQSGLRSLYVRYVLHKLRSWDNGTMHSVDRPIANSRYIAQRICKTYRRAADVIYPPVDIDRFPPCMEKEDYYVAVSRLVPYKRMDLLVKAFAAMPDRKLVIVGSGPDYDKLKARATNNVTLLGFQPHDKMLEAMQKVKAFIMPAEEDFGIVMAEAQAAGTPVLTYSRGGAPEILQLDSNKTPTGLLFHEQSPDAIVQAVEVFETRQADYAPQACHANAKRFHPTAFRRQFAASVDQTLSQYGLVSGGSARTVPSGAAGTPCA